MKKFRNYIYDNHWTIGFIEHDLSDGFDGINNCKDIKWVDNPFKNRWFADPFILDVTHSTINVLVEEYYDPIMRGRISLLTISRKDYSIQDVKVVLELSTHLSFPAIKRVGDKIYIYPENSANGKLSLYLYNKDNYTVTYVQDLCKEALTDATIVDFWGEPMIFSTHLPTQNGHILTIYKRDSGEYVYKTDITFEENVARNAGDWFMIGEKVYRPAQNCNMRYGGGIVFQSVERQGQDYFFKEQGRLELKYKSYNLGCHTFNHYKGISVVDVNGYRRPFIANLMRRITSLRKRMF